MDEEIYDIILNYITKKQVDHGNLFKNDRNFIKSCERFTIINDGLYFAKGGREVILTKNMEETIANDHVEKETGIHLNFDKTYSPLRKFYWWPGMIQTVESFIDNCEECTKGTKKRKIGVLKKMSNFNNVKFDVIGPFEKTFMGNQFLFIASDYKENWADATTITDLKDESLLIAAINMLSYRAGFNEEAIEEPDDFIDELFSFLINTRLSDTFKFFEKSNKLFCDYLTRLIELQPQKDWDRIFFDDNRILVINSSTKELYNKYLKFLNMNNKVSEIAKIDLEVENENINEEIMLTRVQKVELKFKENIIEDKDGLLKENIFEDKYGVLKKNNSEEIKKNSTEEIKKNSTEEIKKKGGIEDNNDKEDAVEVVKKTLKLGSVPQENYGSLLPGKWLDSVVVNDYLKILVKGTSYRFISSLTIEEILKSDSETIKKILTEKNLTLNENEGDIIGVMFVDNNHWIALHIKHKEFYYYDPLDVNRYDEILKLSIFMDAKNKYTIVKMTFLPQEDSYNCGVFACFYFDVVIFKKSRKNFNPDEYRKIMIRELNKRY